MIEILFLTGLLVGFVAVLMCIYPDWAGWEDELR